jgi:UDPglucose 6-dehydrogenase
MIEKEKIGIIGLGFVGSAINNAYQEFLPYVDIVKIDLDPLKACLGTYADLHDASAVFVCVPSPQNTDGSCNSDPLINTLSNLKNFNGVIISKVTAPPSVYDELQTIYPNLVHAPEFLTAANATQDYINGTFSIIGGKIKTFMNEANRIIKLGQPNIKETMFCSISEASLAKYVINTFLATKVIFMNEMAKLADAGGQDWNTIRKLISLDSKRIGNSHTQVPGLDNNYGFGGMCFPKDTAALLKYAESLNVQMNVLDSAVKKNTLLRLTNSK